MKENKMKKYKIQENKIVKVEEGKMEDQIKDLINAFTVADDPYDVAVKMGKRFDWSQKEIEKVENIIRKKYIK